MVFWLVVVLAVVNLLAAAAALWGAWDTIRDLRGGRPTYMSLADHTGTWNRQQLETWFGPPDAEDRYSVSPAQLAAVRPAGWKLGLDAAWLDGVSVAVAAASLYYVNQAPGWSVLAIGLLSLYQLLSWVWASYVVLRDAEWPHQE